MFSAALPVQEAVQPLREALAAHPLVVLQAPPGAGKSTALPLDLLEETWLGGRQVIMLQPRRVAVRAVAARLAEALGERVGQTVGSRVRFESRVSDRSRLEVVTEGILTRRLQRDPELTGVGLVILDEFHERSLNADLALALLREVQGALRDDLRALVMSATLEPGLAERLGAPLVQSSGRSHPVDVRYQAQDSAAAVDDLAENAVRHALVHDEGDILVFLPGVREIRALQDRLGDLSAAVLPLYGDLPVAEQSRALVPDPSGRRKVVLATAIAETSLTIQGVRVVVDGGRARFPTFDPVSGLSGLITGRVTRDSATQRAGRAGRTAPGVAYRLWSERTHALLRETRPPEILEADLAGLTLELAQWGADPGMLPWLDAPPPKRLDAARDLLRSVGALDESGRITAHGAELLRFPTHPRLAHLLTAPGAGPLAADVAAVLEERDPLPRGSGVDLTDRVTALRAHRSGNRGVMRRLSADPRVLDRAERVSRQWRQILNVSPDDAPPSPFAVGELVARAYPDRVALLRTGGSGTGGGRFLLSGGQGVQVPEGDVLASEQALAVAHQDSGPGSVTGEGRVLLAAPLSLRTLEERATWADTVRWDARAGVLLAQRERRLGALVLATAPLPDAPSALREEALVGAVRAEGLDVLNMSTETRAWLDRALAVRAWRPGEDWPDLTDDALLSRLEDWLPPLLNGVRSRSDFGRLPVLAGLQSLLPWPLPQRLDHLAPTHLTVPSGSRVRLIYRADGSPPILAVKLQELFGLADTPTVNEGRTPVLLHLLSPAGRPVQVTQDLRSFWNSSYFEVRKDLRGRYPKHPWPDDPWSHEPTRSVKRRVT